MSEEITLFDKILRKEIPAKIVLEDEAILAFHDINPQAPVHVLVIPKKRLKGFSQFLEASSSEVGEYLKGVARVVKSLGLEENGYRIVFNYGKHGQQTVNYVHAHILGGRPLKWPPG